MSSGPAASPEGPEPASRLRGALLRFGLFALVVAALAAVLLLTPAGDYLEREKAAELLGQLRQAWWAPLALIGGYLVIAPSGVPISPLIFAGGAVFGPLWGWIYNTVGSILGALVSFGLAHALGKELVEQVAGESRIQRAEAMLERHGFWSLVGLRFMPIPFALFNYSAALAGLRFGKFLATSAIGLVPSILMWTYLYHALASAATAGEREALVRNVGLVVGMIALLLLLRPLGRALLKRDEGPADESD